MKILHPIDNYLFKLFPNKIKKVENITNEIELFYTLNNKNSKIEVSNNTITIDIETEEVELNNTKFQELISLCEQARFEEAKSIAVKLTISYPNISEYHRVLGQIYSEINEKEEAINSFKNALRWEPTNTWALIMMGDIYASDKNDINAAIDYYDQVLINNPEDFISLNNIGANLMQITQYTKAIDYLKQAININPDYPNSYFALALIAEEQGNLINTLDYSLTTCEKAEKDSSIYENAFEMAIACTQNKQNKISAQNILFDYTRKIEKLTGNNIDNSSDHEYFDMQKLMQSLYTHKAKEQNANKTFIPKADAEEAFSIKYIQEGLDKYTNVKKSELFKSIIEQIYYTPLNLFIADNLYSDFPALRTLQFTYYMNTIKQHAQELISLEKEETVKPELISISKIYSLVNCLHFKSLFKLEFKEEFNPTQEEIERADSMYKEFSEYRKDREAGEEYEIILNWAKDFKLDELFELNTDENNIKQ